ncbi:hypothetical protein KC19_N044300 [Ceratodon purpureus]|nr:hypothetical protein KC19_N044300 [Ceratodon purpureus]
MSSPMAHVDGGCPWGSQLCHNVIERHLIGLCQSHCCALFQPQNFIPVLSSSGGAQHFGPPHLSQKMTSTSSGQSNIPTQSTSSGQMPVNSNYPQRPPYLHPWASQMMYSGQFLLRLTLLRSCNIFTKDVRHPSLQNNSVPVPHVRNSMSQFAPTGAMENYRRLSPKSQSRYSAELQVQSHSLSSPIPASCRGPVAEMGVRAKTPLVEVRARVAVTQLALRDPTPGCITAITPTFRQYRKPHISQAVPSLGLDGVVPQCYLHSTSHLRT